MEEESRFEAGEATDAFRSANYPQFYRLVESFEFVSEDRPKLEQLWHQAHEIEVCFAENAEMRIVDQRYYYYH